MSSRGPLMRSNVLNAQKTKTRLVELAVII